MNKEDFPVDVTARQAVEESGVALPVKHTAMAVIEFRLIQIDSTEYLLCVALARRRNERLMAAARPGLVDTRILAETGFVGEEQGGTAFSRFFLAWDRCNAATGLGRLDRP
jgi:hypothetical protein